MDVLTVLFLSALVSFTSAVPVVFRDVWTPPLLTPTAGTVWTVGQQVTVTWNTSTKPASVSNPVGELVLGFLANESENLMLDHPLASNVSLQDGQIQVTVPVVPPRDDYIVCLIGDSGNISPEFTIAGGPSSSSAPSSSSTSAAASPSASSDNSASPSAAGTPPSTVTVTSQAGQSPTPTQPASTGVSATVTVTSPAVSPISSSSSGLNEASTTVVVTTSTSLSPSPGALHNAAGPAMNAPKIYTGTFFAFLVLLLL